MKHALLWLCFIVLSGCSTYQQDVQAGLELAKEGQWQEAEAKFSDALDNPHDQLLYYLEVGTLAQNQGDYERSNQLLEQADKLSDTFFRRSFENRAWALLSNPRQANYQGNGIERVYISYLKSLNYLALAKQAQTRQEAIRLQDAALVEVRRIEIKLNEIGAQTPSYADLEAKQNQAFYLKALNWLAGFYTGGRDWDQYLYRDDAWGRYLEGVQYEIQGELDDARISYQAAAKLYEDGYAKQYSLSDVTSQRAWLDTIRMMQKTGWSSDDINRLRDEKLSEESLQQLDAYQDNSAELVVLEHQGFIQHRDEMTLILQAEPYSYSLVLQPLHGGGNIEENDAFRWFTMVYADINPLNLIANYKAGGFWGSYTGLFTKRVILGRGIWRQLEQAKADNLLAQQPIRLTVPYYRRFTLDKQQVQLKILNLASETTTQTQQSITMTSLSDIAFQQQLAVAQRDIYESLLRELVRSWLAYQAASQVEDQATSLILNLVGQVAVFASSAADTRNWLTLPAQIRLTRTPLPPGEYQPTYQVNNKVFKMGTISLSENQTELWNLRNPN
ncbi:COG3014 family protein [Marinomonas epiphytica]